MDDALALVAEWKIGFGAGRADVGVERLDLKAGNGIVDPAIPMLRRRVVIGRGDDRIGAPGLAPRELETLVRLRARDFVHEVAIDIEKRGAVRLGADDMAFPQLVVESARLHGVWTQFDAGRFASNLGLLHE